MVYGPITSWLRDGEKMETVTDFIFLGSKITADGDHSHEIKRCLLFGEKKKKRYDKPRQRIKGPSSQSYIFSSSHVRMWELDHKEGWRIEVFKLWSWRRLLRVPWTARRSNQSILNEINLEYSLEELILKLKVYNILDTWCEEPAHWKRPWC